MNDKLIKDEMKFLSDLRDLTPKCLFEASIFLNILPPGFDVAKGMKILERALDGELEFLFGNPEDYLEIYGEVD